MPVQIGATAHNFSNPTALLSDCHRRIEAFLDSLEAVGMVIDRPLSDGVRSELITALRYFREAAPKHNSDEEESLFPRLRRLTHPGLETALGKLDALEDDHRKTTPLHQEVERLGQAAITRGRLSEADANRFREALGSLKTIYHDHIRIEDDVVLPAAARALSESDRASIAEEMAARRKVSLGRDP